MGNVTKTESSFSSVGRYAPDKPYADIAVKTWADATNPPKAILQLNHGMAEYIDRYDAFARAVAERGWLVVGMDFIGHGDSAPEPDELGYTGVALLGRRNVFIEDMHTLRQRTQAEHPGVPYFMFGHSMGSFVLRAYLGLHGAGLSGAVISGTGTMAPAMVVVAKALLSCIGLTHKPEYRSPFFAAMSIGAYNKPFEKTGARTPCDWLSRDTEQVDKYVADPRCGFTFTVAADRLLIDSLDRAGAASTIAGTPQDVPLLMISGGDDPVGGMGKGVTEVVGAYHKAGVDATLRLYADARHELLNELNRADVTADLIDWLDAQISR